MKSTDVIKNEGETAGNCEYNFFFLNKIKMYHRACITFDRLH